jgi:hypothetical protein
MDAAIAKIFVPGRLFGGLAAALVGGALIAVGIAIGGGLRVLGIGAVVLIAGVAIALSASVEGCVACKQAFEDTHTTLPMAAEEQLAAAVRQAPHDGGAALLALQGAPFVPHTVVKSASVELGYCPKCEAVGQIQYATRKKLPDGSETTEGYSERVVLRDGAVKAVLHMIGERNTAWTKVAYL